MKQPRTDEQTQRLQELQEKERNQELTDDERNELNASMTEDNKKRPEDEVEPS